METRQWLRNWSIFTGKIPLNSTQLDVHVVLDELTQEPFGFGKGEFFIHQGFHFGVFLKIIYCSSITI